MEYKKDLKPTDDIPEFAMQPAKPAEDFDPMVYDRLYAKMKQPAAPSVKEDSEVPLDLEVAATDETEKTLDEKEVAEVAEEIVEIVVEDVVEVEQEDIVASAPHPPEAIPVSLPKAVTTKVLPAGKTQIERTVHYTDFCKLSPVVIYVEEDVLVPDVKPDLDRILCLDGKCRLAERNVHTGPSGIQALRLAGDVTVQALYAPENCDCPSVISVETRIPFREDCPINTYSNSYLTMTSNLESIEYEKINERKFRVKAAIKVCPREYRTQDLKLFSGIEDHEVEYLGDELSMTDVAFRRTETMEISEDLKLKDGSPEIDKILGYNVNVVENHKQISREKAAINGTVYCNVIYQSDDQPEFYQGKTEFTQFIKMDDDGSFSKPLTGSRVGFQVNSISLAPKKDIEGDRTLLSLDMDVDTTMEYYRQMEEPIVKDLYHYKKGVMFDTESTELMHFYGNGSQEATIREIINVPERYGAMCRVVYLTGSPIIKRETLDLGRCVVEGVLPIKLVCMTGEKEKTPFCMEQDLDFRAMMEIPECRPGMEPDCTVSLKELWFDSVNSRQIEVNASIGVAANVFGKDQAELIQTVSFIEDDEPSAQKPAMVVYVAKEGDSPWKVAKKYRAGVDQIREINDLGLDETIKRGTKLLIIR